MKYIIDWVSITYLILEALAIFTRAKRERSMSKIFFEYLSVDDKLSARAVCRDWHDSLGDFDVDYLSESKLKKIKYSEIKKLRFFEIVKIAAYNGSFKLWSGIQMKNNFRTCREIALIYGARGGRSEFVEHLEEEMYDDFDFPTYLMAGCILGSQNMIYSAFEKFVELDNWSMFQSYVGPAVKEAYELGHTSIVEYLLYRGVRDDFNMFINACQNGNSEIVKAFYQLAKHRPEKSSEKTGAIIAYARGYMDIVQIILQNNKGSESDFFNNEDYENIKREKYYYLCEIGNEDVCWMKDPSISLDALITAILFGRIVIVKYLLGKKQFSEAELNIAMSNAYTTGNEEMIKLVSPLIENLNIWKYSHEMLSAGHIKPLVEWINSQHTCELMIDEYSFKLMCEFGYKELIQMAYENGKVELSKLHDCRDIAIRNGFEDIMRLVREICRKNNMDVPKIDDEQFWLDAYPHISAMGAM